eukprot:4679242-Prymnesium_polylepis.1
MVRLRCDTTHVPLFRSGASLAPARDSDWRAASRAARGRAASRSISIRGFSPSQGFNPQLNP